LIAGRGHELIQDLDGYQHELDDRVFARARLAEYEAVDEM
jgi:UDP-N-acetylmuramyl tripeptide synthase